MDKKDLLLFNLDYIKQIPKTKDSKEKYRFYLVRQRRIGEKEFKQLEFEYDDPEMLELIDALMEKLEIKATRYEEIIERDSEKREKRENIINKTSLYSNIALINIIFLSIFFDFLNAIPFEIAEGIGTIGLITSVSAGSLLAAYISPWLSDFINNHSRYSKDIDSLEIINQKKELLQNLKRHLTEKGIPEPVNMFEQCEYTKVFEQSLHNELERILTELFVRKPKNVRAFQILERLNNKKLELVRLRISEVKSDLADVSGDIKSESDGTILSLRTGTVKNVYFKRLQEIQEKNNEAVLQYDAARADLKSQRDFLVSKIEIDLERVAQICKETGCTYIEALMRTLQEQEKELLKNNPKYWELYKKCRHKQVVSEKTSASLANYCEDETETLKQIRIELEEYFGLRRKLTSLRKKQGRLENFFAQYEPQFNEQLKRK